MEIDDGSATLTRSYIEFEPYCRWHREEKEDRIDVHLHGFRREQLKVYISWFGRFITVRGERPVQENMWKRFSKKINISNDYDVDEISSKFVNGILSLIIPKKVPLLKALQLGRKGSLLEMKVGMEATLKILIVVSVGVALGAYLTYKYSASSHVEN